ncbi:Uncharacterised protein [Vibrio cholerae]|nr:Uncharacterised protein [Vibrio cholerae]
MAVFSKQKNELDNAEFLLRVVCLASHVTVSVYFIDG